MTSFIPVTFGLNGASATAHSPLVGPSVTSMSRFPPTVEMRSTAPFSTFTRSWTFLGALRPKSTSLKRTLSPGFAKMVFQPAN